MKRVLEKPFKLEQFTKTRTHIYTIERESLYTCL